MFKKRIFTSFAFVLVLIASMAITVFAAETETDIQTKIDNASPGSTLTIKLVDDLILEKPLTVNKNLTLVFTADQAVKIFSAPLERHFITEGNITIDLNKVTLDGNNNGGGIKHIGVLYITKGTIINCRADNGGAAYIDGTVYVTNGSFKNNTATVNGGAFYVTDWYNQSYADLDSNKALNGGAVYVEKAAFISGGKFNANEATFDGGGLYVNGNSSNVSNILSLSGGSFTKNKALNGNGGGVYVSGTLSRDNSNVLLTAGAFAYNEAYLNGGAVCVTNNNNKSTINVNVKNYITLNKSSNGAGIAVIGYNKLKSSIILNLESKSTISENKAIVYGGGIYSYNATVNTKENATIQKNWAQNGGAFYIRYTNLNIGSDNVIGNTAPNYSNAGIGKMSSQPSTVIGAEKIK